MVDWHLKFRGEYEAARAALQPATAFDAHWQPVAEQLALLMGPDGFDAGREEVLAELRRRLAEGRSEERALLHAAGVHDGDAAPLDPPVRHRAGALKLLRHVYLQNRAGNRRVWVVSLPEEFDDWPTRQLAGEGASPGRARQLLASRIEHFDAAQRQAIAVATQQGLAWCQKAGIVLARAATPMEFGVPGEAGARAEARALVRRWFVEPAAGDRALDATLALLARGFKDIVGTLNRGRFIVTDWVPFRGTTESDESDFLSSEAFTFRGRGEGLDVVYVEGAFFTEMAGSVLRGQANWTRILVHELSHLVCGTHDLVVGMPRYAWNGIGPHAGFPHTEALRNADNWAFFAADCAGALTRGQREMALRQV